METIPISSRQWAGNCMLLLFVVVRTDPVNSSTSGWIKCMILFTGPDIISMYFSLKMFVLSDHRIIYS
jgi:hypothetical protein